MTNPLSALIDYLKSSRAELLKVTWPSREQTVRYSILVIVVSLAMAGFFAALDFGLSRGVQTLLLRVNTAPTENAPTNSPVTAPDVEAVTDTGAPANVKVENVPLEPVSPNLPPPGASN